jgi:hypothetical protein
VVFSYCEDRRLLGHLCLVAFTSGLTRKVLIFFESQEDFLMFPGVS